MAPVLDILDPPKVGEGFPEFDSTASWQKKPTTEVNPTRFSTTEQGGCLRWLQNMSLTSL